LSNGDASGWIGPAILTWLMVVVAAFIVGVLVGGTVGDDGGGDAARPPAAATAPPASPGGGAPLVDVRMIPTIKFDVSEVALPANAEVTVRADNADGAVSHNWAAYTDSSAEELIAMTEICSASCVNEVTFTTPGPGEYFFRCDVHPTQMTGKLLVSKAARVLRPEPRAENRDRSPSSVREPRRVMSDL
jgi:plastocyanin